MIEIAVVTLSFLALASAGCDNQCSGHGTCNVRSECTCFDNWGLGLSHDTGDCSQRICPFELAWVDTPNQRGDHHRYAECAARGICNRDSGECECFPGYEGKGCQRTTCPNACSGHGQCSYIENLGYQSTHFEFNKGGYNAGRDFLPQGPVTLDYYSWDKHKTRGCVCDPEYGDVDCSKRMCPYGTDVMDIRDDMKTFGKYQVQHLTFYPSLAALPKTPATDDGLNTVDSLIGQTFALTFTSRLNETYTTIPIKVPEMGEFPAYPNTGFAAKGVEEPNTAPLESGVPDDPEDFHDFVISVQKALEGLPNRVIDRVEVQGTHSQHVVTLNISFTGNYVQGPQHLLTVRDYVCGDGCTPKLSGLELRPGLQNVTELQLSDYNSFECGRRGKCDYTSGTCNCFAGYTGVSCNDITALV